MLRSMFLDLLLAVILVGSVPSLVQAQWKATTTQLIEEEKPGFGKLCGVVVDHASGDVFINLSDRGFYQGGEGTDGMARLSDARSGGQDEEVGGGSGVWKPDCDKRGWRERMERDG